jgi:hypothetical protein
MTRVRSTAALLVGVLFLIAGVVPKLQGQRLNAVMISLAVVWLAVAGAWRRRGL